MLKKNPKLKTSVLTLKFKNEPIIPDLRAELTQVLP
jgi:hypothetical protein